MPHPSASADTRPRLAAPAGTCDCHIHIYRPESPYPVAATATFKIMVDNPAALYGF